MIVMGRGLEFGNVIGCILKFSRWNWEKHSEAAGKEKEEEFNASL